MQALRSILRSYHVYPCALSCTLTCVIQVVVLPRHKKYEPAGKKAVLRTSQLWLDQADARELQDGEEFTLMDWGNAIVKVGWFVVEP